MKQCEKSRRTTKTPQRRASKNGQAGGHETEIRTKEQKDTQKGRRRPARNDRQGCKPARQTKGGGAWLQSPKKSQTGEQTLSCLVPKRGGNRDCFGNKGFAENPCGMSRFFQEAEDKYSRKSFFLSFCLPTFGQVDQLGGLELEIESSKSSQASCRLSPIKAKNTRDFAQKRIKKASKKNCSTEFLPPKTKTQIKLEIFRQANTSAHVKLL